LSTLFHNSTSDDHIKTNRSEDRIITFNIIDDKALASTGLADPRLFKGGNKLHALREPKSFLWYLKYEMGAVPPALQQRWTHFTRLVEDVTAYYKTRNMAVSRIED